MGLPHSACIALGGHVMWDNLNNSTVNPISGGLCYPPLAWRKAFSFDFGASEQKIYLASPPTSKVLPVQEVLAGHVPQVYP